MLARGCDGEAAESGVEVAPPGAFRGLVAMLARLQLWRGSGSHHATLQRNASSAGRCLQAQARAPVAAIPAGDSLLGGTNAVRCQNRTCGLTDTAGRSTVEYIDS